MIDIRKLKELVRLMVENNLSEIDLRDQEENVTVKRGSAETIIQHQPVIYNGAAPASSSSAPPAAHAATAAPAAPASAPSDNGLVPIESPMVGTFYSAPNPDSDPFVKVGDTVSQGSVMCMVEAMKVYNEIKAETSGTIDRICVNSGDAVEFGQALFMIKPS